MILKTHKSNCLVKTSTFSGEKKSAQNTDIPSPLQTSEKNDKIDCIRATT